MLLCCSKLEPDDDFALPHHFTAEIRLDVQTAWVSPHRICLFHIPLEMHCLNKIGSPCMLCVLLPSSGQEWFFKSLQMCLVDLVVFFSSAVKPLGNCLRYDYIVFYMRDRWIDGWT